MYFYSAYGLVIQSAVALPELVTTTLRNADVVIQRGTVQRSSCELDMGLYRFHAANQDVYFAWEQAGTFLARNGKEIIFETPPHVSEDLIRFPLLGMALAVILHQRQLFIMHSSTIAINGHAVAFVGCKGRGKSTTAAALYAQGHSLLADDVVAIDIHTNPNHPLIVPGFPQFKLWPESASAALGDDPQMLPRLAAGYEKRSRCAVEQFCSEPVPLKRIYLLSEGSTFAIKPIEAQIGLRHLIANSHIARIAAPLVQQGTGAISHFQNCINLANSVPVCWLERPRSLNLLPELVKLVEKDVATSSLVQVL